MAKPTRVTPAEKPVEGGQVLRLLVSGPDVHETITLPDMGTLSVGRDDDADIRVPDPSASRQHASLHVGAIVEIEDPLHTSADLDSDPGADTPEDLYTEPAGGESLPALPPTPEKQPE